MKKIKKTKQTKGESETALKYADSIIATLREPFLVINKNLRIVSANRSFYITFKVTKKETIGRLLFNLGHRQWNIPKLIKLLKEILPQKRVVTNYEVEHEFRTIGHRIMSLNASQLRVQKKIAKLITEGGEEEEEELILLAIEDITEQEKLKKKIILSEKLSALGKLAGSLVHELRNSLSAVRNSTYSLKTFDFQDKHIKKNLWILEEEGNRMDGIINDILGFAFGFAKGRKPNNTKKDIGKIIKKSLEEVIIPKNVKINIKFKRTPMLLVEEIHMIQLFSNIIKNAIEAMPRGGILTIATKKRDNYILINIKDTGTGIKKNDLIKIFEPLFSTKSQGTGLGLVACQRIIKLYDGIINVKSKFGKGTEFVIKIPIKRWGGSIFKT